jgi:hypothetical protein
VGAKSPVHIARSSDEDLLVNLRSSLKEAHTSEKEIDSSLVTFLLALSVISSSQPSPSPIFSVEPPQSWRELLHSCAADVDGSTFELAYSRQRHAREIRWNRLQELQSHD